MIGDPKKDPKKRSRSHSPERDVAIFTMNTTASANEMTGAMPTVDKLPLGADGLLDLFPDLTTDPEDD
ncbi:MAG TPA: hypothetical protein PK629_11935 [Oscillospiraceae bacterium]|nr:hypothetical protein [Oscillospiraceae bacterium]HPF55873.1 hypothetical protein [Clostridiales bacterium]HPK36445.1 hypothetical protein [Oscillospiraceae bacterium]HPR76370.1 hypothetical protein [Oscillospiraceae bacterium]